MTIHILDLALILFKFLFYCLGCGLIAMFCLWPINDQPVSKGQWRTWVAMCAILFILMFTNWIKFAL